jgi:hypothetical protein
MKTDHADKWLEGIVADDNTVDVAVLTLRNRLEAMHSFCLLLRTMPMRTSSTFTNCAFGPVVPRPP